MRQAQTWLLACLLRMRTNASGGSGRAVVAQCRGGDQTRSVPDKHRCRSRTAQRPGAIWLLNVLCKPPRQARVLQVRSGRSLSSASLLVQRASFRCDLAAQRPLQASSSSSGPEVARCRAAAGEARHVGIGRQYLARRAQGRRVGGNAAAGPPGAHFPTRPLHFALPGAHSCVQAQGTARRTTYLKYAFLACSQLYLHPSLTSGGSSLQ